MLDHPESIDMHIEKYYKKYLFFWCPLKTWGGGVRIFLTDSFLYISFYSEWSEKNVLRNKITFFILLFVKN